MSRKGSRSAGGKARGPVIQPLSLLRPRLDEILARPDFAALQQQALESELDRLTQGVRVEDFVSVALRAAAAASEGSAGVLDRVLPGWLARRGALDALRTLLERGGLDDRRDALARRWLQAAGGEPPPAQERPVEVRAFRYANEFQGIVAVVWCNDPRGRKHQGLSFLLDFVDTWNGAVKDVIVFRSRPWNRIWGSYLGRWEEQGMPLQPLEPDEAGRQILSALDANRRQGIRLPQDLVGARDLFLEMLQVLPPAAEEFTQADFDQLAGSGRLPEHLSRAEKVPWGELGPAEAEND